MCGSLRQVAEAFQGFRDDMEKGEFPRSEHGYRMPPGEAKMLEERLKIRK